MSDTLILLPAYNNAGTLEKVLRPCWPGKGRGRPSSGT